MGTNEVQLKNDLLLPLETTREINIVVPHEDGNDFFLKIQPKHFFTHP